MLCFLGFVCFFVCTFLLDADRRSKYNEEMKDTQEELIQLQQWIIVLYINVFWCDHNRSVLSLERCLMASQNLGELLNE